MELNNQESELLYAALMSAFPERHTLKQMVKHRLGQRLEAIAGGENQTQVVFNLIEWAESKGKELDLITGAYQENPGNPKLRAFCQQLCQNPAENFPELSNFCQELLKAQVATYNDTPFDVQIKAEDLISDQGVDFRPLQDLLAVGNWEEADQETLAVMLKIAGREQEGSLNIESIKNFPCQDLHKINRLWVKYSKGHFGFSVQKRIWQSPEVNSDITKFISRVGWGWFEPENSLLVIKGINLLNFDLSAPAGQLPVAVTYNHPHGENTRTKMISKIIVCNL
ncbi:GUN4 domain-containing protein [Nostoc sp.]|uniref:GUN4 domain-containing protein n=1 Tax=Nostoc sp. TaxID=1180 RepID=UPI002FF61A67